MRTPVRLAAMVLLTALAAAIGGWAGIRYGMAHSTPQPELDRLLHEQLDLTPDQERRIAGLEADFAAKRKPLEVEIGAANHDLAAAILAQHTYGPPAEQAIERFHRALSELQVETIKHILAMRAVLTPEQAERFDRTVTKALVPDQP